MASRSERAAVAAAVGVAAVGCMAVWGWSLRPDKLGVWMWTAAFLPICWGYVELMQQRGDESSTGYAIMTVHRTVVAWTAVILLLHVAPRLAVEAGLLDEGWVPASARLAGIGGGAGLMIFGNLLPKLPSPWTLASEPFDWQRVHRFGGMAFLAGGAFATAAWLLLPLPLARRYATAAVVVAVALGVGRKLISLATHDPRRQPSKAR